MDAVFRALADPTRRRILDALFAQDGQTVGELCARFAADAILEAYFGWDAQRFPGRGEHNLARARGQWALYQAVRDTRDQRRRILGC